MRRETPPWFQDRLTQVGGTNRYGEPIFKLVWSQTETMRVGGYFAEDGFIGYRDMPAVGLDPCWAIVMWEPAECYGTPYRWYAQHEDEATGLQTLGEYPHHGQHRLIQKLLHREVINGVMVTLRMEPNSFIIDTMVRMISLWQHLSNESKKAAMELELELERKDYLRRTKDAYDDSRVPWRGATASYTNQGCRTSLIAKKIELMQRTMGQAMKIASRQKLGLRQY